MYGCWRDAERAPRTQQSEVLARVRKCCTCLFVCTPMDLHLLLGGVETIDVDAWEAGTAYQGAGMTKDHQLARWFWKNIRQMEPIEQGKVLLFASLLSAAGMFIPWG